VIETEPVDKKSQGLQLAALAKQREQVANRVGTALAKFGRCSPGEDTSSIVHFAEGRAVNLLPQLLSTLDPDLVVAGTHGRTGIANLVLGSVAETLLDVMHRDMLVVPR
jgi:nucleotide-binding universal stress UspA family protein